MQNLQEFKNYLLQIGYSKGSQYQIFYCINEFLLRPNLPPLGELKGADILHFYDYLQTRPLKKRTGALSEVMINHYIYALKVFFSWLETTEQIKENPISSLRFKKPNYNPREPLSQDEIKQLFKATTTNKEKALLHLFYSCGLRRTEAENLNTADIHFTQSLLYVREGKGAKRRVIPINKKVKTALESPLNPPRGTFSEAYMLNAKGNRMSGASYNKLLKQIISRMENPPLEGREAVTLHHLRHSIATHLLENGLSIEFVRDFLGHSVLETTQIYTKVFKHQLKDL